MNFFSALFIVATIFSVQVAGQTSDDQKELLAKHNRECFAQFGADPVLLSKAKNGEFTDDAKLKQHILCLSKKIGSQNEAGQIQENLLQAKLYRYLHSQEEANKVLRKCAVTKDTPEETAYWMIKCLKGDPYNISLI